MKPSFELGTVRFKKNGQGYVKARFGWKKSKEFCQVVKLYKASGNLDLLVDQKDPKWLKGFLTKNGEVRGGRIFILPNGKKLDKAFSLFASDLRIHDQDSGDHWDVIFQNKGGTYAYCYTLEKKKEHSKRKYRKVWEFDKVHSKLLQEVEKGLRDKEDYLAVPLHTLLKTYMRVGNEIYYKAHGHKGLTTLKKKDVKVKGNLVTFNYLAKDGVPRLIEEKFSKTYIKRLQQLLKGKRSEFVFTAPSSKHPLSEQYFKKAFMNYVGKEFYPHIVRSHYASKQVQEFLKGHRKISKEEMDQLFLDIAHHLGHRKFVKKKQQWEDSSSVTVSHYIQPELVEKVKSRINIL